MRAYRLERLYHVLETPTGLHFPRALTFPAFERKMRPALFTFQGVMDSQSFLSAALHVLPIGFVWTHILCHLLAVYMCEDSIAFESISHACPTKDWTWNSLPLMCQ